MSRHSNKKHILPYWASANSDCHERRFIQIGNSWFFDDKVKTLKSSSRLLYLCMMIEAGGHPSFIFPKSAATKYGFNWSTATDCIKELIKLGFIEKTLSGKNLRQPNQYKFSIAWKVKTLSAD